MQEEIQTQLLSDEQNDFFSPDQGAARQQSNEGNFLKYDAPPPIELSYDLKGRPERFYNRELSWLQFNARVLEQAQNDEVPLLERVRFLSISATNLDEFYTVRVAGLRELAEAGNFSPAIDGLTPAEQLDLINRDARKLMNEQQRVWNQLKLLLHAEHIEILDPEALTKSDKNFLLRYFTEKVFPILTPLSVDPAHPFPFIANEGFCLALRLKNARNGKKIKSLLPIPQQIERFIALPSKKSDSRRLITLEEVLLLNLDLLFPGYKETGHCSFRVLRNSDMEVEEEAEDLAREFEVALKRRRRGQVIRLKISKTAPKSLRRLIAQSLDVEEDEIIDIDGLIGLSQLKELVGEDRTDLLWPKFTPRIPERVQDHEDDMFAAIRQKDMLLHHPYETFDMVVRFLEQAAQDPDVVAIKQTLYRTSDESPIVEALCAAAEEGKSVTALVELKARFDEAANIRQSRRLERAGAHVVYGLLDYKIHAKLSSVIRREEGHLKHYTHFGTGNYHPITAKVYTDLSLFTCDPALGRDATKIFNFLSSYVQPQDLEKMHYAPVTLKSHLLERIAHEQELAQKGKPGEIWAKMNALIEPDLIDALYEAGQAGVKIKLVVRGICGLRPQIKGLSENIQVKSIVGRFLEHSRIVCFGNGKRLPSPDAQVYVSSADWMDRNMKRRVETLVEIHNPTVKEQLVDQIMAANLSDTAQSWLLKADGSWHRTASADDQPAFNCHRFFMDHPSLSGRGSAGAADVPKLTHNDHFLSNNRDI